MDGTTFPDRRRDRVVFCVGHKIGDTIDLNGARGHFVLSVENYEELGAWYVRAKDDAERYPDQREWALQAVEDTFKYYSIMIQAKN